MYLALDAGFTSSASIEELGETHGPAGPLAIIALLAMAKQQGAAGAVRTTARKLAADAFLSGPDEAQRVVAHALAIGVLEPVDPVEDDDRAIHVRFPSWSDWQPRAANAERQANFRARNNGKREVTL